ncbi:bifunctional heptose 7-phosphate kinase/heptose 1-phosphate adenyltransferase [Emticicia sp. TH156]|uniref:bifunctional heptose 7-phosphate kinase/heptose 1-phosphate adenyltransferase n=1 Tax=Emticicia sp. TH156 TaxID=2067454 RepID=UPI000C77F4C4|nr:bifunctional ADP-heptose synthase [Emticicia sp. TH156]PLK44118.1 D-glycero-beta-D-manno-heptose-7-phosphate kinase [Emticicia sp. TH156]
MNVNQIFDSFNNLRVLIIGDVMIDSYIFGKVDRISPEAPIPVVTVKQKEIRLGGAGNVAMNIKSLGATPVLCSVVGKDAEAKDLIELLASNQLPTDGIIQSSNRITTIKQRILAGSQHVVRIDSEMDSVINAEERSQLIEKAKSLIPTCQVVIFEDYDKGVLDEESIQEIVAFARQHKVPTIVDPKKRNFKYYKGADLFKPNLKELKEGLKIDFDADNLDEVKAVVAEAKNALGVNGIFLTLSERGVFIDFENEIHHLPAHRRSITDVSGAGDTVVSIAAICLGLNLPPRTIAELSNLGGGLVCEYVGVMPIEKQKLQNEYLKHHA